MRRIFVSDEGKLPSRACVLKHKDAKKCLVCPNCEHADTMMGQPKKIYCKGVNL